MGVKVNGLIFQAIHNESLLSVAHILMPQAQYQCSLFKQFTTLLRASDTILKCQRSSINVLFSSNSQPYKWQLTHLIDVKCLISMFTFHAAKIHIITESAILFLHEHARAPVKQVTGDIVNLSIGQKKRGTNLRI